MRGASAERVAQAVTDREALFDSQGFAGRLPDGLLVRDVLGRQPIFVERSDDAEANWSFAPGDLDDPEPIPAGHVFDPERRATERAFSLPDPEYAADEREAVRTLGSALRESLASVGTASTAPDDLAVAFSGGVDSAVVASAVDAPLYVVGFPESHDVEAARRAARLMSREEDLRVVELSPADVERAVPEVARATGRTNAMDVQIALPLSLAAEEAARDGFDRLAVGQGADELFGGYAKVARAPEDPRVEAETVRGAAREVIGTLPDQLERDVLALRAAGVEPVAPLLDDRVVRAALALPGESLVDSRGERKKAFRLAAREFVPDGVAFREKKAVQYGSLVARELDRLARQAGFKRRMDDHVSAYVESRLAEDS
ncbi:asparagine synthase C-terminal domain-containing protein [Halorussus salinus]|uniref:asparagine synthase C-terminal domain-containing protein n=1 Tax=Halorussus salinus TaxID=1364935 RepID=UPI001091AA1B|nr:asparagine synthase-related protein [Halorussus salinus]